MARGDSDDLYERLLAINAEAFAAALYKTAYHALAAALHRAISGDDNQGLLAVV